MTEQQIPLPFRKPARLSAAQRKAMIQTKLQDYPVYPAAREAKRPMERISGTVEGFGFLIFPESASAPPCWSFSGGVGEWVERIGRKYER